MKMALRRPACWRQPQWHRLHQRPRAQARTNDATETLAIKQTLQEHAYKTRISSTKSMTGHMLGAAGALAPFVCIKVIGEGVILPTINLDDPDPDCDLNYTPLTAQKAQVRVALSNSFGFGGHSPHYVARILFTGA